ncbi:MAG: hypothetical protein HKN37_16545 [Rhodothermales bacterium]|nr:hypothetical protein [Rhodothermales bacterium]
MDTMLVPVAAISMLIVPVACFVWKFNDVRSGLVSRIGGIGRYAAWSATPLLAYVAILFSFVGAEELFNVSLVSEGYARSVVVLGGGGLVILAVGTVVFSILVMSSGNKDT